MLKNYFKVAFRNLWRHKGYSLLNILGLAIGMTACFLIFLYVRFELSYDDFNTKKDRIYRVVADIKTPTEVINAGGPSWAVPPNAKDEFPEIENFVRIAANDNVLFRLGDKKFQEENVMWADSAFFQVFDYKLLKGDPKTALKEPFSVVLSQKMAKKYFGKEDPMGKTILVTGDGSPAKVTGIMKDIPANSYIQGEPVLSMSTITQKFDAGLDSQWGNYGANAYFLLKKGTNAKKLEAKFPGFLERRNGKEMKQSQMYATLFLEPLKDVYLRSTRNGDSKGNITNVYIFSIVGLFILLIAAINFVNLTTARASDRAKEVGIRKVVGAGKFQLASQFLGESIIICFIAFLLSIGLSVVLLPGFNSLAGKTVSEGVFSNGGNIGLLLGVAVSIGVLAGIYPSLVLSAFRPVAVLKGRFATGNKGIILRKALVIAQFSISVALIIGTIIVYNQMSFMRNRELGFQKDQMMIVDTNGDKGRDALYTSLASLPGVEGEALSSSVPSTGNPGAYSEIENTHGDLQIANLDLYFVGFDYIPVYKMKVLAGRPFSRDFPTDTTQSMVLNEAAIKMFGYSKPADAIGKKFKQWGREGQIIGVVKDFHFRGLQEPIKPLSMRIEQGRTNLLSLHVSAKNIPATIAAVEKNYKQFIPNRPFSYFFLDEHFNEQYKSEEQFGKLFLNFAILAIFISCLGLLGLASYSTMQRTREIGIRKVLGASVSGIVNLLSKEFLTLVGISFLIAMPAAWYFMHTWLKDFAYRTPINWWVFVLAGFLAIIIAFVTISFQAIKAAVANPVKSLRTE